LFKDQDKDKDLSSKDKDKDQDKDCILVLKESLRTRTRTNITADIVLNHLLFDGPTDSQFYSYVLLDELDLLSKNSEIKHSVEIRVVD